MNPVATLPKKILLLRHASAQWPSPGQKDFDRQLDSKGKAEGEALAKWFFTTKQTVTTLLCSRAARAQETAGFLLRNPNFDPEVQILDSLYTGTRDTYLAELGNRADDASVLIVGHNPMIENTFQWLVGEPVALGAIGDGFPTCGLAVINHTTHSTAGSLELQAFFRP